MKKILILSAALFISTNQAFAINATANAKVVTPITISQTTGLNFGSFASSSSSGTINQAGTVTGGVTAVTPTAARTAGVFAVAGEVVVNTAYNFTLPSTATLNSGGNSMTATLSFASGTASRTFDGAGTETVTVNGVLAVGANQVAGDYSGTYTVTVAY